MTVVDLPTTYECHADDDRAETVATDGHSATVTASSGARPDAEVVTIEADDNVAAQTERLVAELDDRRLLAGIVFAGRCSEYRGEAIRLARAGFARYDRRQHKLSHLGADDRQPGEISYPEFFRRVALEAFVACHNVWLAGQVLDRLITEG